MSDDRWRDGYDDWKLRSDRDDGPQEEDETMSEIDELENCSSPKEMKRLLMAWAERKLEESTPSRDVLTLLAEGLATNRLAFRKRRNRQPGEPHLIAELKDPVWWAERIVEIEEENG